MKKRRRIREIKLTLLNGYEQNIGWHNYFQSTRHVTKTDQITLESVKRAKRIMGKAIALLILQSCIATLTLFVMYINPDYQAALEKFDVYNLHMAGLGTMIISGLFLTLNTQCGINCTVMTFFIWLVYAAS